MFQNWDSCTVNGVATLKCIPVLFNNFISAALLFVGFTAVFFIVYAGFSFVTSGGDPKKVQGARQTMTFAIIGLLIVLSAFAIILFIGYITGTRDCLSSFNDINKFMTGCQ
jgi:hypothetical protein